MGKIRVNRKYIWKCFYLSNREKWGNYLTKRSSVVTVIFYVAMKDD